MSEQTSKTYPAGDAHTDPKAPVKVDISLVIQGEHITVERVLFNGEPAKDCPRLFDKPLDEGFLNGLWTMHLMRLYDPERRIYSYCHHFETCWTKCW